MKDKKGYGKSPSKELIADEEFGLKQSKDELKNLKSKWIKLPSILRLIDFLEHYIKEKEKFIETLRKYG